MKNFNIKFLGLALSALVSFTSCDYNDQFDEAGLDNFQLPEATMTFAELKSKYNSDENKENLISKNETYANGTAHKYADMFTVYSIPSSAKAIINGVVISTDEDGNTYKKIVVRDLADGSTMDISIDASGLSGIWPQGQKVSVDASSLFIGDFANYPNLGTLNYNSNTNRLRYEVGRMSYNAAKAHIRKSGLPDKNLVTPVDITIEELNTNGKNYFGQLVRIKGVRFGYFTDNATSTTPSNFQSKYYKLIDDTQEEIVYSAENSLNVPVSRAIVDDNNNYSSVTTSFYAKFASKYLPQGKHDVIAIVGWYRDQAKNEGNYQLSVQRFSEITPSAE